MFSFCDIKCGIRKISTISCCECSFNALIKTSFSSYIGAKFIIQIILLEVSAIYYIKDSDQNSGLYASMSTVAL